ncbi:MAG: endonuclease III [Armatimonadota bacterium]|nr:endonuclease III [bacterium]
MSYQSPQAKLEFDIDTVMNRIREAIKPFPKAVLFELAEEGFNSVFEQLVACIISIRTYDEVTGPVARNLFATARTPAEMIHLDANQIDRLIERSTFHESKADQILQIARITESIYGGKLPCDVEVLMSFHGVGVKCANLVLGIACGQPRISVDVHVHRVTNRWGYVSTASPEQTTLALEAKLPKDYWIEINRLLVPFGKNICTGRLPACSTCPVLVWCRQVGVRAHR